VTVLDTVPPALPVLPQPAAARRLSPQSPASRHRARMPCRLPFGSGTPGGSSLMTLLAGIAIYRQSSGNPAKEPDGFLNTGAGPESTLLLPGGPSNVTLQRFFRLVHVLTHVARLELRGRD